jgi:hypothetical protein
MTRDQYNKWIAALRSGEFKQQQGKMGNLNEGFCCLGLYCYVNNIRNSDEYELDEYNADNSSNNTQGEKNDSSDKSLAYYNDGLYEENPDGEKVWLKPTLTFIEIADIIEANPAEWVIIQEEGELTC